MNTEIATAFEAAAKLDGPDELALCAFRFLLRDPNQDINRVIQFIQNDAQLTAETLRHCNTAMHRIDEPIADLSWAVFILGYAEVYDIVDILIERRSRKALLSPALSIGLDPFAETEPPEAYPLSSQPRLCSAAFAAD